MKSTTKCLKFTVWVMLFALLMVFPLAAHSKDKIRIGQAVSLSGPNAIIHAAGALVPQTLWVEGVNAKGGIYVKQYGKKLPIEWIQYDDKSDRSFNFHFLPLIVGASYLLNFRRRSYSVSSLFRDSQTPGLICRLCFPILRDTVPCLCMPEEPIPSLAGSGL